MLAPERRQRAPHRGDVERVAWVPGEPAQQRMGDTAPVDQVEVALAESRASRVEARRGHARIHHSHRVGKQGIQTAREPGRLEGRLGREARDLAKRVDTGVGAARSRQLDRPAQDATAGITHEPLHRGTIRLHLPTREVRAVVGESQAQSGQGRPQRIKSSAICMPFSAAPLRSWSPTTQKLRALGRVRSWRMRPTKQSSCPSTVTGMG